jgi:hypothetical protein
MIWRSRRLTFKGAFFLIEEAAEKPADAVNLAGSLDRVKHYFAPGLCAFRGRSLEPPGFERINLRIAARTPGTPTRRADAMEPPGGRNMATVPVFEPDDFHHGLLGRATGLSPRQYLGSLRRNSSEAFSENQVPASYLTIGSGIASPSARGSDAA